MNKKEEQPVWVRFRDFVPGKKYHAMSLAGTVEVDDKGQYWWNKPTGDKIDIYPNVDCVASEKTQ
jgi:hypothetical protein